MKTGDKAKVDPNLTGMDEWIEGIVIDVKNNPFKGTIIAIKDNLNRIFFGEEKFFKLLNQ
jgi:hypothetical protein